MTETLSIQPGDEVVLHCSITLEDGTVAESTFGDEPIRIIMGDESVLVNGLQLALYGLKVGDRESIIVDAENAFGMPDDEAIQQMPLSDFPADMQLQEGQIIAFSTPAGEEIPGAIKRVGEEAVTVDFNHPLAGHELKFEAEILEIIPKEQWEKER
jgi:FKBP-type peptidyl-prolyl cis-trans isomerase SlpA